MNVYLVEATTKDKATGKRMVVWSGEYAEPATLNDGIKVDGRDEVTKVWKSERFTNFLDTQRNATKESRSAMIKQLLAAMVAGDAIKVVELSTKLGIDLKKGLTKILADLQVEPTTEPEPEPEDDTDDDPMDEIAQALLDDAGK
ncbi:MAG: hypothetical protein WC444_06180 [Candidatus Paceibacterota bacterium]